MEYYCQKNKNKNFTLKETQLIIKNILQGVQHMAKFNIMHRDLKLENILY